MSHKEATPIHSHIHVLKAWPAPFEAVRSGAKKFEFRKNDRNYEAGDLLVLSEYEPETKSYTRRALAMRVTYVLHGGQCCVPVGYCVLSIEPWESAAQ